MSQNEEELYEQHVMRHYEEPYHRGPFAAATHRARVDNPVCGDSIEISLRVTPAGRIESAWFTAAGCIISQAAASMLVERAEGMAIEQVRQFTADDMLALFRARLTARRVQCCLLPWQALLRTIDAPIQGR